MLHQSEVLMDAYVLLAFNFFVCWLLLDSAILGWVLGEIRDYWRGRRGWQAAVVSLLDCYGCFGFWTGLLIAVFLTDYRILECLVFAGAASAVSLAGQSLLERCDDHV